MARATIEKILIMGLPGAGKTTLAQKLAPILGAVWFDADFVRQELWPELTYGRLDRVENARRFGVLCDHINRSGRSTIASFICPTQEARLAFGAHFTIWIDRIEQGRFADTNEMFERPNNANLRLVSGTVDDWANRALHAIRLRSAA